MTREEAIAEYKRLLVSEWSDNDERETIKLLSALTDIRVASGESYDLDAIVALINPHEDPFIFDVQSLLINQMMGGLWTDLALEHGDEGDWKRLGDAMFKYIESIEDEAHKQTMLSSYFEGCGKSLDALEAAQKSLKLTSTTEIVYATRASDVYYQLHDLQMWNELGEFMRTLPEEVRHELEGRV